MVYLVTCVTFICVNHVNLLFSEIPTPMAARTMKLVANSLIKLANLVDAKVHIHILWSEICLAVVLQYL